MKKIDLHIHTKASISDAPFDFDLNKLKEYVKKLNIDCIAITNHNLFDIDQYKLICEELDITVLPGVEVDLEKGHILVISDIIDAPDLSTKCLKLSQHINSKDDYISTDTFHEIFNDLNKYILIPHYDKKPILKDSVISKLNANICAREVSGIKKFLSNIKNNESIVPVCFSDSRIKSNLENFSTKQIYVDIEEVTFKGIKYCLTDKTKVFLTEKGRNDYFQATDLGLKLSTGLNVILGERSSGKTYTLDRIEKSIDNIKYIKQFSLLQNDDKKFQDLLSRRHSDISNNYLNSFKKIIDEVKNIDLEKNNLEIDNYLDSLFKYATDSANEDSFSKTKLFTETNFKIDDLNSLNELIKSIDLLLINKKYKSLINRFINLEELKSLKIELINEYLKIEELNKKYNWLNSIIINIKGQLKLRSSVTQPIDIDLYEHIKDKRKVKKFIEVANKVKNDQIVANEEINHFKIVAEAKPFKAASELQKLCTNRPKFSTAFLHYEEPYKYLTELKKLDLNESDLYKYFVKIEYKILNRYGVSVSGGERSEFNLLHEIKDALKYDLLLIDEPESSFDNLFLKNEVNSLLRDISQTIPVVIVTHNNTVGASIKPNYIICTKKEIIDDEIIYKLYYGKPEDKQLVNDAGEVINNYDNILNCLEAGSDEYNKRREETYEILKN
jgi:ABC-type dipeptide/oligopeptide/nickel transport system ATPase subunit